ncbi:MAG TPA: hypothetical protein PKH07_19515, partial [bacterium]|nr:hypothetical protein [bacterium]
TFLDDDGNASFHLRQGDCEVARHDAMLECAAADIVAMCEYLLTTRDRVEIFKNIRLLERSADFLDSRRDPDNGLFRAGPASNLLAPSYAGTRMEDGSYSWGYLAGLQVNYCAALSRLIEVEKLAQQADAVKRYSARLDAALKALPQLMTEGGYLVKYIDQFGVKHGVYGAEKFGYMEGTCNVDAIAFGVLDLQASHRAYAAMKAVAGLWYKGLIRNNYPILDDTYDHWGTKEPKELLWRYGFWVDGGVWGTNVARMVLAQYRLNDFDGVWASLSTIMAEMRQGTANAIWISTDMGTSGRPNELDTYAVPGAALRGLWECRYDAESLTIVPHVPPGIKHFRQKQPLRFGKKRIYLEIENEGSRLLSAKVNGDVASVTDRLRLPYVSL